MPKDELYHGAGAHEYDSKRSGTKTWRREDEIVRDYLGKAHQQAGMTVVDVPVGTGRFFDLYEDFQFRVLGFDISADMLREAEKRLRLGVSLSLGDITDLPLATGAADLAVCIRLLHLVDGQTRRKAIAELGRVVHSTGHVVVGTRMHEWSREIPFHQNLKNWLRVALRTLRFRTRRANSRSHGRRAVMRSFKQAGLVVTSQRVATRYPDGSYYPIFLLQPSEGTNARGKRITVELFGLPGSGKTTLTRGAQEAGRIEFVDGFAAMEERSAWWCVRQRPLMAARLLVRLVPCGREVLSPPARKIVVTALRQHVATTSAGSAVALFEEGTCHEAWRQMIRGRPVSQRLLRAVIPAADMTLILDPPLQLIEQRLLMKPHPGPINRQLIASDLHGPLWQQAVSAFEAIANTVENGRKRSLRYNNESDGDTGIAFLEEAVRAESAAR